MPTHPKQSHITRVKRYSPTTVAGSLSGLAFILTQTPGISPHVTTILIIFAGIAVIVLGKVAADCPANCPGTDARGNPLTKSVSITRTLLPGLAAVLCLVFTGCTALPANTISQLAANTNLVDIDIQTLYGHGHLLRLGPVPGMSVSKSTDGNITITYPPPASTSPPAK